MFINFNYFSNKIGANNFWGSSWFSEIKILYLPKYIVKKNEKIMGHYIGPSSLMGSFYIFVYNLYVNKFLATRNISKIRSFSYWTSSKILVIMICIHWLCKYDKNKIDSVYIVVTHFVFSKTQIFNEYNIAS